MAPASRFYTSSKSSTARIGAEGHMRSRIMYIELRAVDLTETTLYRR